MQRLKARYGYIFTRKSGPKPLKNAIFSAFAAKTLVFVIFHDSFGF